MNDQLNLKDAWVQVLYRIAMIVPNAILGDGQKKRGQRDIVAKLIPFLIIVLSAASITNLSTRAYAHHAGFSSYLVGAGLAALVPLAVFVAIKIEGTGYKAVVWVIASLFALISAAIQYQVYLPAAAPTMDQMLEALAFGAGVPAAECLLAAMEAFLLRQEDNHNQALVLADAEAIRQAEEQAAIKRKQEQDEADQRQRESADRVHAERLREIELQAHAAKLAQDAELEREAKLAALRIKEAAAASKLSSKRVADNVAKNVATDKNTPVQQPDATERRNTLLNMLQQLGDIGPSAFGEKLNADRTTIYRDFKALEKAGIVHQNGNGWTMGGK